MINRLLPLVLVALLWAQPAWAAITHQQSASPVAADASGTTVTIDLTSVASGELITVDIKWEGSDTTLTVCSDGTTCAADHVLTCAAHQDAGNNAVWVSQCYRLSSVATGTVTYTATLGAARGFKMAFAKRFSYTGSLSLDVTAAGDEGGINGTAMASASFTTTGSDELVNVVTGQYNASTTSNEQIGATVADAVQDSSNYSTAFYRILNATAANITATADAGSSTAWVVSVITFKTAGGGGGGGSGCSLALLGVGSC